MSVKSLMTGLADSVRLKTGKTNDMTLEQIAAAIMSITVAGDMGFTCGSFTTTATGSAKTIQHGLGQVPGAVIFIKKASTDSSTSGTSTYTYDALMSIVFGPESGHAYCYHYYRRGNSTTASTSTRTWNHSVTVPDSMFGTGKAVHNYYVTNINENSFTTPSKLHSGRPYIWIAFRAPLI